MNIVVFYQYFGTPKGSWSTRVYEITRRWVQAGNKVTVVTAPYEKSDIRTTRFIERLVIDGVDIIVIDSADSNRDRFVKRAAKALVFSLTSVYFALTLKADIVITSSGPITIGIPGLAAKWIRKRKLVFEVRDLWPQGAIELGKITSSLSISLGRWFEKLCYQNAALIVPCSKGMQEEVEKTIPGARTLTVPNASDPDLFLIAKEYPMNFPNSLAGQKIFLYAGSLGLMDDCSQIIKAMDFVNDKSISVVFIGDGADRQYLEGLSARSINHNIFFMGLIPKTEVVKWFSICTATFVTFRDLKVLHTSSPNKMFDSFAAGRPIIQSTRGWIKELVEQENCGINVAPDSPFDFATAMHVLANDEDQRSLMSENSKRLGRTIFNREYLAQVYLNELSKINNE